MDEKDRKQLEDFCKQYTLDRYNVRKKQTEEDKKCSMQTFMCTVPHEQPISDMEACFGLLTWASIIWFLFF